MSLPEPSVMPIQCRRNFFTETSGPALYAWAQELPSRRGDRLRVIAANARLNYAEWLPLILDREFDLEALHRNPHCPSAAALFLGKTPMPALLEWASGNRERIHFIAGHAPMNAISGWQLLEHPDFSCGTPNLGFQGHGLQHPKNQKPYRLHKDDRLALEANRNASWDIRAFLTQSRPSRLLRWALRNHDEAPIRLLILAWYARLDSATWGTLVTLPESHFTRGFRRYYTQREWHDAILKNSSVPEDIACIIEMCRF